MSTTLRDTGAVTQADLSANQVDFCHLVRLFLPSGFGEKFYTDYREGDFTGQAIDGVSSAQVWTHIGFNPGSLKQSQENPLEVSWISFDNLDNTFTNWGQSPGLRGRRITVYRALFNPTTDAFIGSYRQYDGRIDDGVFSKIAQLTLQAHKTDWSRKVPGSLQGPLCNNIYKGRFCKFPGGNPEPGSQLTCSHTRGDCNLRTNIVNFNGDDLMPTANTEIAFE